MQHIEPFYNWRHLYIASEDSKSIFYNKIYSEFSYTNTIYNYYIHPQWDEFGASNLFIKIIFVDYSEGYAIIELIGEWNDAIENDIMKLRRDVMDLLEDNGIVKFILICENVLNFHSSDDSYYEDWYLNVIDEQGWVVILNLPEQSFHDFKLSKIERYINFMDVFSWRTLKPELLLYQVENNLIKRIN